MSWLRRLVPTQANNDDRGSPIARYSFFMIAAVILGRSLIHTFKADSGVNSIASITTISGSPDPNTVVYLFSSLWGTQQLITVTI